MISQANPVYMVDLKSHWIRREPVYRVLLYYYEVRWRAHPVSAGWARV